MIKNNELDETMLFIKKRLLLEEPHFHRDEGINEYLVICRAWEINSNEIILKDSINYLIDRGNIKILNIDEKGIRYVRWVREELNMI